MVNDIKLDGISAYLNVNKAQKKSVDSTKPVESTGAITISNSLNQLTKLMSSSHDEVNHQQHIEQIKNKIETNQYQVDVDKIARKMVNFL